MKTSLLTALVVSALLGLPPASAHAAAGKPYSDGRFRGRIAYSADGNHNDPDDWIASPVTLAILAEAGLKDRLVHFDYNCILPLTDPAWETIHAASVLGAAERYGFDKARFFDCRKDLDAALASITKAINDSSADDPLYFVSAGPMEVPYRAIQKSDPAKRPFVYCLSHSRWNDGFASRYKFTFTKRSVIEQDVRWVQIRDQNRLLSFGRYGQPAPPEEFQPYFWMRDSRAANVRWLWERMLWSWRATDSPEIPTSLQRAFRTTDDCKPVEGGRKILVSSSSGAVALVDRESRRALFCAAAPNAHSIELLPGGRIAAAASVAVGGNSILVFDLATGKKLASDRLASAHGVVWDDERGWLWALGDDELRAYRVMNGPEGRCELEMAFQTKLPDSSGHDLVAVPGSTRLFLSTGKHGWYFDRVTREFVPHEVLADRPDLKSYSVHRRTGRVAYVQAQGTNWWAERVHFLNPPGVLHLPGQRLYKARWRQPSLPRSQ